MRHLLPTVGLGAVFLLSGIPEAFGRRVDSVLKAAIAEAFPASSSWKSLPPKSRASRAPQLLEVRKGEVLLGYVVELYPVSRSGPFRIVVAVSPDETVMAVKVPKYPHRRGRGVRKKTFLEQFNGVSYGEPLKLREQVDGVSGATSSSGALTLGVRQALLLVHRHRQKE